MNNETVLYAVIEAIIFLIPLGTLIWKMAKLAAKVDQNDKDIQEAKEEIKEVKVEHKVNIDTLLSKIDSVIGSVNEIKISIAEIKANSKKDEK